MSSSSGSSGIGGIDPYRLFGLQKNFNLEDLRKKYKSIAIQVHPDKTGGSDYLFKQCYTAYKYLLAEYEQRQSDKPFYDLRNQSRSYVKQQGTDDGSRRAAMNMMQQASQASQASQAAQASQASSHSSSSSSTGSKGSTGRFNIAKFNRVFDEARLDDPNHDHGYGNWMSQSSKNRDDIDVRNFMGDFNQDRFNRTFDKKVPVSKQQTQALIRKTNEPQCVSLGSRQGQAFTELGVAKIDDFGDRLTNKGISYADYKRAHSTERLVDPALVAAAEQKSREIHMPSAMKQLEADRDKISYMMNDRDRHVYERRRLKQQRADNERMEYIKRQDSVIERTYHRLNKLLLGS